MISRNEHGVLKNTDNHDHILTPNQSLQHILWKHSSQLLHGLMSVQVAGLWGGEQFLDPGMRFSGAMESNWRWHVGQSGGRSPSPSNWEKVGWDPAFLSTVRIWRRFSSVGEGWIWRGRRGGGVAGALHFRQWKGKARNAWCRAARALALALLAAEPRGRRWSPAAWQAGRDGTEAGDVEWVELEMGEGSALSSSTSSLTLVAVPPLVDIVRVADLPAFLKTRNMSNMEANSSTIFSTESELILRLWRSSKYCFLSLSLL